MFHDDLFYRAIDTIDAKAFLAKTGVANFKSGTVYLHRIVIDNWMKSAPVGSAAKAFATTGLMAAWAASGDVELYDVLGICLHPVQQGSTFRYTEGAWTSLGDPWTDEKVAGDATWYIDIVTAVRTGGFASPNPKEWSQIIATASPRTSSLPSVYQVGVLPIAADDVFRGEPEVDDIMVKLFRYWSKIEPFYQVMGVGEGRFTQRSINTDSKAWSYSSSGYWGEFGQGWCLGSGFEPWEGIHPLPLIDVGGDGKLPPGAKGPGSKSPVSGESILIGGASAVAAFALVRASMRSLSKRRKR